MQTHGVGDDADHGLGTMLSAAFGQVAHDGGVGVKEIITSHAGLAGYASGDHDHIASLQTVAQLTGTLVTGDGGGGGAVRQVSGHARCVLDVVE